MNLMTTREKIFEIAKQVAGYAVFSLSCTAFSIMLVMLS